MTEYLIIKYEESAWAQRVEASSPKRALAAAEPHLPAGTYVAIPMRSWKPLTVKVEQTTKVTIG